MRRKTLLGAILIIISCFGCQTSLPNKAGQSADGLKTKANQEDAVAQYILGLMYYEGQGVKQNFVEAIKWCQQSADQELVDAQYFVGIMYAQGKGVSQSLAEAAEWFEKAADQGHAGAQYKIGVMYYKGQGVPQNYVKSYAYWNVAAAFNMQKAKESLSIVKAKMTSTQVAEGQRQAEILLNKISK